MHVMKNAGPHPPQGPTPPLSGASTRMEEGSCWLSPSPTGGAWPVRTAYTSTCLVAPRPDLKAGLLGVHLESDHPRSILIVRPVGLNSREQGMMIAWSPELPSAAG